MQSIKISGVILAGGKSSRMGADKGLLKFNEKPLIQHVIDYLNPFCEELLISTNNSHYRVFGHKIIPDEILSIGPLGGIFTCLQEIINDKVIITACDIPEIPVSILEKIYDGAELSDVIFLETIGKTIQPLPLLLSKKTLGILRNQIENKNYKFCDFIEICRHSPDLKSMSIKLKNPLKNINFAKDLKI